MSGIKSVRGRTTAISASKAYSGGAPPFGQTLLPPAQYKGSWVMFNNQMAYSTGAGWTQPLTILRNVTTLTVGPGGNFSKLGDALAFFTIFTPVAAQYDFLGRVLILNNHTITDQTLMTAQQLGWVTIESQTLTTVSVERTANVSTVEFSTPHGLAIGRTFALHKCTDTSFNILTGTVTGVPSATKIEYSQTASDVANTADTTGECHVDIDVDVSAFTELDPFILTAADQTMPLMLFTNGSAPIINCRFKKIGTAPTNPATSNPYFTEALALRGASFVTLLDPGIANPPATTWAFRAGFYGFTTNIRCGSGSISRITSVELANASATNILVSAGSAIITLSRIRGAAGAANARFQAGAKGALFSTDYQTTQGSNSNTDKIIGSGSIVSIGPTSLGGTSQDEIVPTGAGLVFDERVGLTPNWAGYLTPESFTVSTLPSASAFARSLIYVSNETGGATIAFSDGTNWRRVQDRNIVS
jgi:hypothetical protein